MDASLFDLDRFTPYLLNRAAGRIVEAFESELAVHKLSLAQWRVLASVWHEGELTQAGIASHTSIDVSTLSRMLGNMQRRGLLKRERSLEDSRAVLVHLTPEGKKMAENLIPKALAVEARALSGLSDAEIHKLHVLLRRMFDNLD
ncbi:MAG: MarR family transcriptional regulator [Alphaproteobacteria bacterium]|nr:MarR family transcriptional regulator [Alphaproteobacteria bacterium]MBF0354565.1 MarR family transcriptional regulator [Alphaproteobacteria bacterium]